MIKTKSLDEVAETSWLREGSRLEPTSPYLQTGGEQCSLLVSPTLQVCYTGPEESSAAEFQVLRKIKKDPGGSRALTEGPLPLRWTPSGASQGWGGENKSLPSATSLSIEAPSKIAPLSALIRSQKMIDWGRSAVWRAENQFMPSFLGSNLSLVIFLIFPLKNLSISGGCWSWPSSRPEIYLVLNLCTIEDPAKVPGLCNHAQTASKGNWRGLGRELTFQKPDWTWLREAWEVCVRMMIQHEVSWVKWEVTTDCWEGILMKFLREERILADRQ